jgi:hypothetical protein
MHAFPVIPFNGSAGWNRLPGGIALGYIWIIVCRIGAIVPGLTGVRLAVVVAPPRICIICPRQSRAGQPPAIASVVPAMIPVTSTDIGETAVRIDTMVYNPDLPTRIVRISSGQAHQRVVRQRLRADRYRHDLYFRARAVLNGSPPPWVPPRDVPAVPAPAAEAGPEFPEPPGWAQSCVQ